jgi:hypothetical protein
VQPAVRPEQIAAAVIQDARVIDVVRPRTDRAEVREDIPDFLRVGRDGVAAVNVDHRLTVRGEKCGARQIETPSLNLRLNRSGACTWQTSVISQRAGETSTMFAAITGMSRAAAVVSGAAIVACARAQVDAVAYHVNVTVRPGYNFPNADAALGYGHGHLRQGGTGRLAQMLAAHADNDNNTLIPNNKRLNDGRGGQRLHHPAPGRSRKRPTNRSALAVGGAVAHQRRWATAH